MNCKYVYIITALIIIWDMNLKKSNAKIYKFEVFVYKEMASVLPTSDAWIKISEIIPLQLPISCILTEVNVIFITFKNNLIFIKIVLV